MRSRAATLRHKGGVGGPPRRACCQAMGAASPPFLCRATQEQACASRALGATHEASRSRGPEVPAAVGSGLLAATRLRGYVQAVVRTAFTVLLTVPLLGIAACDDDNGDEGGTTAAPDVEPTARTAAESDEAQPAKVNLERFLLRKEQRRAALRSGQVLGMKERRSIYVPPVSQA